MIPLGRAKGIKADTGQMIVLSPESLPVISGIQ